MTRQPWLLGGAALAVVLTLVVVRIGKAFDKRRAEIAARRTELKSEAHALADATRPTHDS